MSDNASNSEHEANRWRFSLRSLLIAVTILAVSIWVTYTFHRRVLVPENEPEYLTAAFSSAREKIFHVFSPLFAAFLAIAIGGVWSAVVNWRQEGAITAGAALCIPVLSIVVPSVFGIIGLTIGLCVGGVVFFAAVFQSIATERNARVCFVVGVNIAWIVCITAYVHCCLQYASEL